MGVGDAQVSPLPRRKPIGTAPGLPWPSVRCSCFAFVASAPDLPAVGWFLLTWPSSVPEPNPGLAQSRVTQEILAKLVLGESMIELAAGSGSRILN